VYEIKADSTPLVAIVKNYRTLGDLKMSDGAGIGERTPEYYLALSSNYYNRGQYEECVGAALDALRLKPDYDLAYNNICAAYNKLKQWDRAIEAGEKAVRLNPNNQLAKNNLAWAKSEKMKSEKVKAPTAE
jgi:tetratricopeptide (TPR) repeat protein